MSLSDQLHSIRSRMDDARQARRFSSAIGRRSEAQQWDLALDDLQFEEMQLMERIAELKQETYDGGPVSGAMCPSEHIQYLGNRGGALCITG